MAEIKKKYTNADLSDTNANITNKALELINNYDKGDLHSALMYFLQGGTKETRKRNDVCRLDQDLKYDVAINIQLNNRRNGKETAAQVKIEENILKYFGILSKKEKIEPNNEVEKTSSLRTNRQIIDWRSKFENWYNKNKNKFNSSINSIAKKIIDGSVVGASNIRTEYDNIRQEIAKLNTNEFNDTLLENVLKEVKEGLKESLNSDPRKNTIIFSQ